MSDKAPRLTVLVVDDEKNTREGLGRALRRDYEVVLAESAAAAIQTLGERPVDVMLSDVRMPGMDGLGLLREARRLHPDLVVIMLTAYGSVETAVEAMKVGAADFLTKPVNLDHLDITISKAVRQRALESENRALKSRLDSKFGLENIVGSSPAMERLFDIVRQAAPTQATVLIEGASGTGKELVAQAIHRLSARAAGPFVAVHCAALSSSLLESELFGHEKGAFTGAVVQRKGRFEMAHGGTLFLDEISEIEPSVQVKLLRVLEERRFERVGGVDTVDVDIRIIAATNRDLRKYVEEGKFREDLFYRLDVVEIKMPPLKERGGDIALLCNRFMKEFAEVNARPVSRFAPEAAAILQAYSWPGNVRELRNVIARACLLASQARIEPADLALPAPGRSHLPASSQAEPDRERISAALTHADGNISQAAAELGLSRQALYRRMERHGIARP
jgi:DNA-binding NtrC family response regulator